MGYLENYKEWCDSPYFDAATKQELAEIAGDDNEIKDRFVSIEKRSMNYEKAVIERTYIA